MPLFSWRKKEVREAKDALEQSIRERPVVDRYVKSLFVRQERNHFAPLIEQAFRARRETDVDRDGHNPNYPGHNSGH